MSEVFEHNPGDHEDPMPAPTWIIGLLGAVLLVVIGMGLTALFFNAQTQTDVRQVVDPDSPRLEALRRSQIARLHADPHWQISTNITTNEQEKALIIPIDRAMTLVEKEYGPKK